MKQINLEEHVNLLIDESRGIYIPNSFYNNFDLSVWGINPEDYKDLADPEREYYWDAWDELITRAEYTDPKGVKWFLYQDGSLFAVTKEFMERD